MRLRILHCPALVGGNPSALSRAQRSAGAQSWCVTLDANPFGYEVDEDLHAGRGRLRREIARWKLVMRALREFEVIHYNFGRSMAPMRARVGGKRALAPLALLYNLLYAAPLEGCDVRWARRRGKVVAVTFQGDDARQGDVVRRKPVHFVHEVAADYYTAEGDRNTQRRIRAFDAHADLIYALNPDLLAVLPSRAQFQGYASVDPQLWRPVPKTSDATSRLRVVHAPSHRGVKGTRHVIEAVRRLHAAGVDFEFVLVENLRNAEARALYATADLAIDQLLAGFYGGLAVELMALAVPVICYLNEEDMQRIPSTMRGELPFIEATPTTIEAVLREWLTTRRSALPDLGRRSRIRATMARSPRDCARDPR
jgi:hypothetical protein